MTADLYNLVPYHTRVHFDAHPDRLAAVGRLAGLQPAPVDRCRYLEIGCGTGSHIISLAHYLPHSRFHGIDLAGVPISEGERTRRDLQLDNLTLSAADLRDIPTGWGKFDYIVAHGVYSWVPPEIRDALLRVCSERLAPDGIAFISYNTLPGRHARQYLSNLMRFHARGADDPAQRVEQALWSVDFLLSKSRLPEPWRNLLAKEADALRAMPDYQLFHDDLAAHSDPVYFSDFVTHAARHSLQYVGEADTPEMFDPTGLLRDISADLLNREQYLDFLKARMFRQTLLCPADRALSRPALQDLLEGFLFSSLTRTLEDGQIQGLRGIRIRPSHQASANVAAALGEMYPEPLSFADLEPYAGSREALLDILTGMVMSGFADLHVYNFPFQTTVTERPRASRLARSQARDSSTVVNACCRLVNLDEIGRELIQLLDGTRDQAQIAKDVSRAPGAPSLGEIVRHLPTSLEWMARVALLEM